MSEYTEKQEEWRKLRTDAISEMFDNEDEYGIYPTGKFFDTIDAYVFPLQKQLEIAMEALRWYEDNAIEAYKEPAEEALKRIEEVGRGD